MKVLFIAKNIPRPTKINNKIIYVLADKLSDFYDITFLRPREKVPFWLKKSSKFGDLYGLKGWTYKNFKITTYPYLQLPFKKAKYWLFTTFSQSGKKFITDNEFDLVHAHYLLPDGFIAYQIFKKYNIPYVITFRNQDKRYLESISSFNPDFQKAKTIISNAKTIITTNLAYKEFVDHHFQTDCKIMPHGLDASLFETTLTKPKDKTINITCVAEAIKRKNIDWVIRAFKEYTGNKTIKLNIIGDGPELEKLKQIAGTDQGITFFGRLSHTEVLTKLGESDIFVLPSFNETFGMVYLEAAATQNAIIGFKGEGVWGVFEENNEMLFCNDYDEFEKQLHHLIKNKTDRSKLTVNAFSKAETMEWSKILQKYEEIYSANATEENEK